MKLVILITYDTQLKISLKLNKFILWPPQGIFKPEIQKVSRINTNTTQFVVVAFINKQKV